MAYPNFLLYNRPGGTQGGMAAFVFHSLVLGIRGVCNLHKRCEHLHPVKCPTFLCPQSDRLGMEFREMTFCMLV